MDFGMNSGFVERLGQERARARAEHLAVKRVAAWAVWEEEAVVA